VIYLILSMGLIFPVILIFHTMQLVNNRSYRLKNLLQIPSGKIHYSSKYKSLSQIFRIKKSTDNQLYALKDSAEFADLMAVTLIAGMNPRSALDSIIDFSPPVFSSGIKEAIKQNAFGKPLIYALEEMCLREENKILTPLIKQIGIAMDRGTPLSGVTRSFAQDQRIKYRSLLTKQAAQKELAMLIPVVFVVLPSVLAVAMYPALTVLQKMG
jgi:pilus assembly protein TadC